MNQEMHDSMMDLCEATEDIRDLLKKDTGKQIVVKPPDVKVAAPNVTVQAPPPPTVNVSIPKQPRKWVCDITARDQEGRIKQVTYTAQD